MAARNSTRRSDRAIPQPVPHAAQGVKSPLYGDSQPRTIWFPSHFLAQVETQPGGLVAMLTVALSAHLGKGVQ